MSNQEKNYRASLQAEARERWKNKKRVRLIIGEKVRSFPLPEGAAIVLEVVQGDEVTRIHGSFDGGMK